MRNGLGNFIIKLVIILKSYLTPAMYNRGNQSNQENKDMEETLVQINDNEFEKDREADRIALNNMFRALAEYGRKVRLRRQAECTNAACGRMGKDQPAEKIKVKR